MASVTHTVERFGDAPAEWDAFVRFAERGTQCHLWGWKSVIERVLDHECLYLAARAPDGRVEGVLPLVRVSSRLFGSYLVSMPFLNYGGAVGSDRAVQALVARAIEHPAGEGAQSSAPAAKGRHRRAVRPRSGRSILRGVFAAHARSGHTDTVPASVRSTG